MTDFNNKLLHPRILNTDLRIFFFVFSELFIFERQPSNYPMEPAAINKEEIKGKVRFLHGEVLKTSQAIEDRRKKLEKAMLLGNGYKGKIKIIFATEEGERMVETTVWATTDSTVQLKGDVSIPIHSICDVII